MSEDTFFTELELSASECAALNAAVRFVAGCCGPLPFGISDGGISAHYEALLCDKCGEAARSKADRYSLTLNGFELYYAIYAVNTLRNYDSLQLQRDGVRAEEKEEARRELLELIALSKKIARK